MKHGVEQEIQVVNNDGRLVYDVEKILAIIPSEYKKYHEKGGIYKDVYDSQLEIATGAVNDLEELEQQLIDLRSIVSEKARNLDLRLIATGANYISKPNVGELFAEQHHIDAPTKKDKLCISNLLRLFAPEFFALSVNSPIGQGRITKWKSYRASIQTMDASARVNPNIKQAPYLTMEDIQRGFLEKFNYEPTFEKKRKKSRYYDVSPFTQKDRFSGDWKPTIEVRLFDSQPSIPLTLSYACILQALVLKSKQFKNIPNIEITYNRNMAIERGMHAHFIFDDCKNYSFLPQHNIDCGDAPVVLQSFLDWIDDEIRELGYQRYLQPIKNMLSQQRTLADWQENLYRKNRQDYINSMIEHTMDSFDREVITNKFDILLTTDQSKKELFDPLIQKQAEQLINDVKKIHQLDPRDLISSLVAIGEVMPEKKGEMDTYIDQAVVLLSPDGSIKQNPYLTAYFIELLLMYDKTDSSVFERSTTWLFQTIKKGNTSNEQIWMQAYVLSVLKRIGYEKDQFEEQLSLLQQSDTQHIEPWVLAYIVDALTVFGFPADNKVEIILQQLQQNHWMSSVIDDVTGTALIYRLLRNTGYQNLQIINFIKNQMRDEAVQRKLSLHRRALILRSLSEEVVEL